MKSHTPKGKLAREHIIAAAERLFAARGFHGTSLRDVADAAEAPLATLIYHFEKKEALYAAVLAGIASALDADLRSAVNGVDIGPNPAGYVSSGAWVSHLDRAVRVLVRWAEDEPRRVSLLLRELLDNESRVAHAARLPMAAPMQALTDFVERGRRAGVFAAPEPVETLVLHVVGAISYVVVSRPTIRRIVGKDRERRLAKSWEKDSIHLARRVVGAPQTHTVQESQHGTKDRDRPHRARPRPHRSAHDRS